MKKIIGLIICLALVVILKNPIYNSRSYRLSKWNLLFVNKILLHSKVV